MSIRHQAYCGQSFCHESLISSSVCAWLKRANPTYWILQLLTLCTRILSLSNPEEIFFPDQESGTAERHCRCAHATSPSVRRIHGEPGQSPTTPDCCSVSCKRWRQEGLHGEVQLIPIFFYPFACVSRNYHFATVCLQFEFYIFVVLHTSHFDQDQVL